MRGESVFTPIAKFNDFYRFPWHSSVYCIFSVYEKSKHCWLLFKFQAFIQSMGTMGEVSTDYRDSEEDQWMEQQSSARLFERSRIKVLAGSYIWIEFFCCLPWTPNDLSTLKLNAHLPMISICTCMLTESLIKPQPTLHCKLFIILALWIVMIILQLGRFFARLLTVLTLRCI